MLLATEGLCGPKANLEPGLRKIAIAILIQAIRDLQCTGRSKQASEWKADARVWFASEQNEAGSFVWICDILGWDPGKTRKNVRRLRMHWQKPEVVH